MLAGATPTSPARRALSVVAALAVALGVLVSTPARSEAAEPALTVAGLQTNARTNPLGIAGAAPTFSWKSASAGRGVVQSAYEVRVGSSAGADDVWSSGKVTSDEQVDVRYGGPALTSQTRYSWQVRVWDGNDQASDWSTPAWFETGLLDPSEWSADWIGKSADGETDRWTDYTADIDFDIDQLAIGVFLRAKDTGNAYMWQISTADGTGVPKFRPHKRVNGGYTLLDNKPIPGITSAQLLDGTHRLSITLDGATITTRLDGVEIDQRTDATFAKGFIGFRQDFANNIDETADVKAVKVTAKDGTVLLDTDFSAGNPFNGGTVTDAGLRVGSRSDVLLRTQDSNEPLLRKEFTVDPDKTVARARVYASAHGVYELQLNGAKVGNQFLAPGWTDYAQRIQYQTYDVTDQLRSGDNAIGAELGNGWWAGKVGMWGPGMYGSNVGLIAQLRIDYTDGSSQVVKTDGSWTSHYGPFVAADNIDGETYDARAEQTGWDEPGYDDTGWNPVTVAADTDTAKLVPQPDEPVRVTGERPALTRTAAPDAANTWIYDLGQNMVGVARMRLTGTAGSTVRIRYGEELRPDGSLYVGNLRAAKVTDYYTFAADGTVTYTPKFTQHGFRYVEISGTSAAPVLADVTGVVWGSDLPATGTLSTSDPMLNQLASNISWGQRGNFLSIPTDTPARDERLGWTGDINVFSPTASYLRDTRAFLSKWTTDLRDAAMPDGNLPGIAPVPPGIDLGSGLGWSDAQITVPYAVWHAHGDNDIVRANYAAMTKFLDFVKAGAGADLIDSARGHWDDWLNLDDNTVSSLLGTAYFAEDARMLSEMAAAIGEDADAATLATLSHDVREAFTHEFVAADGTVTSNSQTAYAMALGMNLVTDPALRVKVGEKFVAKLAMSDNHLTTGFLGTPWLLPALTSIGRSDLAYTMILKKDYPSWGYEIEHGATTMWERWNSIKPDGTFGDEGMNSFNHYAYGAVGDWMYQNIGGISAVEAGYKKSRIAPAIGGGLTSGHGEFDSVYGTISSTWAKEGGDVTLDVEVPVNTTSTVSIPAGNLAAVTESGVPVDQADGVTDATYADGVVTIKVGSGSYHFRADARRARYGDLLAAIAQTDQHAGDLATAGDLGADDRAHVGDSLGEAKSDVEAAMAADLTGDETAVRQHLADGLAAIRGLQTWVAGSSADGPVKNDLTTRLTNLESLFGAALADALGITVAVPPVADAAQPGSEVAGVVDVANQGDAAVTDVQSKVTVDDWAVDPATATRASIGAGESAQLPFVATVPKHQDPATYDAHATVTLTTTYGTFSVEATTPWVAVDSGVEITAITSAHPAAGSEERATLTATVHNAGDAAVSGQVDVELPDGWADVPASDRVTLAAGETKDIDVPLFAGLETVGGDTPVKATFEDQGVALATRNGNVTVNLPAPPTQAPLDYVDFGNAASESAHALQAAPFSGTNVEAGFDRRYAHSSHPGSWFSAEVHVTPGQPFLLRNRETFDGAKTKRYNIWVDDVLVKPGFTLQQTVGGQSAKLYQVLIDDPAVLANDGTVRIKYEFPLDAGGFYDPSIADSWVLPVPADTLAPLASATVTSTAAPGDNGWYRGDASVAIRAVDNRGGTPVTETGSPTGWQPYVGPVTVTGDGKHAFSYRAKDAAGNSTGERTAQVWIDGTAPDTQVAIARGSGVDGSDRATLAFTATDATSGVATTSYRIDGGAWTVLGAEKPVVQGYGAHTVEFLSTDVAGNSEPLRTAVVDLADVDGIAAIVAPQVSGTPTYGSRLTATTGSWNTKGLTFGYQWRRDGSVIAGATAASYVPGKADVGKRLSVTVTASKDGLAPASATSAATARITKARSRTGLRATSTTVAKGRSVRLVVAVAAATRPTGSVAVYENGRRVRTVRLSASGTAVAMVKMTTKGVRTFKVVYLGSDTVAGSTSARVRVRVR